jgi:beta-phosphoglucomutase-like phosphatase (HAD superfamily)
MIMKKIDLVIFDCDGVLVDSESITNELMISLLKPLGISLTREEYVQRYVGRTIEDFIKQISEEYNISLSETFIQGFQREALVRLHEYLDEIEGVQDLIRRITVPFCVASNSAETKVKFMLEVTGLLKYFEGKIFSSTQVPRPKPAPDVYLKAASVNGI